MRLNEQNTKEINSNDQGGMMQMLIPKTVRYRSERLVISRKEDEVGQAIITMDE